MENIFYLKYMMMVILIPFINLDFYPPKPSQSDYLNIMSFNIRMNYQDDGVNNWEHRKALIKEVIDNHEPDVIGIQEAFYKQYIEMDTMLKTYKSFGPKLGYQGAESVGIFYLQDKLLLLDSGAFWLSETPQVQSLGWDSNLRRMVCWGKFQVKESSKIFYFFSTHFDHKGEEARKKSSELLKKKVHEISKLNHAFIAGDFNFRQESIYYNMISNLSSRIPGFYDCFYLAKEKSGPNWTTHGFGKVSEDKRPKIDYLFSKNPIEVKKYLNITFHKNDVYPSDHNPQMIQIIL